MSAPEAYHAREIFDDPAFPLAVRKGIHGTDVAPHTHDFIELVLVAGGSARHSLSFADRPSVAAPHLLVEGDVFAVAPGERHTYSESQGLTIYNVLFQPELVAAAREELRTIRGIAGLLLLEPLFRSETGFRHKLHLAAAAQRTVRQCLDAIAEEMSRKPSGWRVLARARFLECLVLLGRSFEAQNAQPIDAKRLTGQHAAIQRAVAFIEQHYPEHLSLAGIARQAFLSPHHFCTAFKQATGVSPWTYLTQTRLERAKELLRDTNQTVTEIALDVGFSDSSYFARVFKASEGISPSAFRRSATNS